MRESLIVAVIAAVIGYCAAVEGYDTLACIGFGCVLTNGPAWLTRRERWGGPCS